MATPVTPSRNIINQEEVDRKSAISENLLTRISGSINFIIDRIFQRIGFEYSGRHPQNSVSPYNGMGGNRYFKTAVDIDHYYLTNNTAGSSGSFSCNFEVFDDANISLGNLFATPPALASSVGNNALVGRDVTNSQDISPGAGKTVGTLNLTSLGAGYTIRPFVVSGQVDGENAYFELIVKEQN